MSNNLSLVKTPYNSKAFEKKYERFTMPSMTIPDQTMSMQTLLERYAKGLPLGGIKTPIFDEEDDLPDMRTLDISERHDLMREKVQELQEIEERLNQKPTPPQLTTPPAEPAGSGEVPIT